MPKHTTSESHKAEEERLNEPVLKTPSVLPITPGHKAHDVVGAGVQASMDVTAAKAMAIMKAHIEYRRHSYRHMSADLQRACEYVIDHAIGKARQKIEHSGGILTYGSLAKEAEKIALKPRDVLADAEEIATKRQRLADIQDPETANIRAGLERMLARADEVAEPETAQGTPLSTSEAASSDSDKAEAIEDTLEENTDEPR